MATSDDIASALQSTSRGALQSLVIQEIGGPSPLKLTLKGGAMVEIGASWETTSRGSSYTPLGASQGYATVTGVEWGKTDMTLALDAAFLRPGDVAVEGTQAPTSPAELAGLFTQLQTRGRECLVQVAGYVRRGILRSAKKTPNRGHNLDTSTGRLTGFSGVNVDLALSWEWSGDGAPLQAPVELQGGPQVLASLGAADAAFGKGLALGDAFKPDFLSQISGAIGSVRGGISSLRSALKQITSLAQAPANLANQALAAARSLGNLTSDLESAIHDTADEYKAVGAGVSGLLGAKKAAKAVADGCHLTRDAAAAVFDALAARRPRVIGVRPGQLLAEVAKKELGSADRWPEIAAANEIAGQAVPAGTFQVELPARGA